MILRYMLFTLVFWVAWVVSLTATIAADVIEAPIRDALVIAVQSNYPPFTQNDITGQPAGMFIDIWKLWSEKVGHEVSFRMSDWIGTLDALKSGEADIHSGLYYSETRDKWMDYSRAFYTNGSSFYHRIDDAALPLGFDLKGVKIGVVKGYLQEAFLKGAYPMAIVVALLDDMELIKALALGKIDLFLRASATNN